MIFSQDRAELRKMYADAWQKHLDKTPLSPLEAQIAQVVEEHPEYHDAVGRELGQDFTVEGGKTNPFLHMGLHLSVRDQVATDRPPGIAAIFSQLTHMAGDRHAAEHRMIDCLAEMLWEAQREQQPPDEFQYLDRLRRLAM